MRYIPFSLIQYSHIANCGIRLTEMHLYAKWPRETNGGCTITQNQARFAHAFIIYTHSLHQNSDFGAKKYTPRPAFFFGISTAMEEARHAMPLPLASASRASARVW